jgi:hypothetical protein
MYCQETKPLTRACNHSSLGRSSPCSDQKQRHRFTSNAGEVLPPALPSPTNRLPGFPIRIVQWQKMPAHARTWGLETNAWPETLAYMSPAVFASEVALRSWSIQSPWLGWPDFYRSGGHANARGSFRGHNSKVCANAKILLARFGNPCDLRLRSSGITRSPHKEEK